jgi:peptidoglycan hydrolase CwlO-like protein
MEINEKKLEKILEGQRKKYQDDFQRYMGAVVEDFDDKLKMIAESVSGIQQQLIALRDMVAKNTEDIDIMKGSMNLMRSDIDVMKSDISTIKFDLKRKVDLDEFKTLEKRVLFLERKMSHA